MRPLRKFFRELAFLAHTLEKLKYLRSFLSNDLPEKKINLSKKDASFFNLHFEKKDFFKMLAFYFFIFK